MRAARPALAVVVLADQLATVTIENHHRRGAASAVPTRLAERVYGGRAAESTGASGIRRSTTCIDQSVGSGCAGLADVPRAPRPQATEAPPWTSRLPGRRNDPLV
jgi:hypothetical protein